MPFRIVWNITGICNYQCLFCCTASKNSNTTSENNNFDFDNALCDEIISSNELPLQKKLTVLENLIHKRKVKIDFSGGDPLLFNDNYEVILRASQLLGRDNISVTSTGFALSRISDDGIVEITGGIDFTYDYPYYLKHVHRPPGYNQLNLEQAYRAKILGLKVKAQVPLHPYLDNLEILDKIIEDLISHNVDEIELLRFFPVGRKVADEIDSSNNDFIKEAINYLNENLTKNQLTKIRFECAIRGLLKKPNNLACNMFINKLGLDRFGNLYTCAWTSNLNIIPTKNPFYLGNLKKSSMVHLLENHRAKRIKKRLLENQPHCKLFSYLNGGKTFNACFQKLDPLYQIIS